MRFEKWQALGNDYLIVERDELPFELTAVRVRRLCDGHFGPGADGVLLLSAAEHPEHVADLRIFNPDGSEAELSGNGAREAIMYLRRQEWIDKNEFAIGTAAGEIRPTITGPDTCMVDMGRASLTSKDFPGGPEDGRDGVMAAGQIWAFGSFDRYQYTTSEPPKKIPQPRNSQPSTFMAKSYFRAFEMAGISCSIPCDSRPHLMCG